MANDVLLLSVRILLRRVFDDDNLTRLGSPRKESTQGVVNACEGIPLPGGFVEVSLIATVSDVLVKAIHRVGGKVTAFHWATVDSWWTPPLGDGRGAEARQNGP